MVVEALRRVALGVVNVCLSPSCTLHRTCALSSPTEYGTLCGRGIAKCVCAHAHVRLSVCLRVSCCLYLAM